MDGYHYSMIMSTQDSCRRENQRRRSHTNQTEGNAQPSYLQAPKNFLQNLYKDKLFACDYYGTKLKNMIDQEYESIESAHSRQEKIMQNQIHKVQNQNQMLDKKKSNLSVDLMKAEKIKQSYLKKRYDHKHDEIKRKLQQEKKQLIEQEYSEHMQNIKQRQQSRFQQLVEQQKQRELEYKTKQGPHLSQTISKKSMLEQQETHKCMQMLNELQEQQYKNSVILQEKQSLHSQNKAKYESHLERILNNFQQKKQLEIQNHIQKLGEKLTKIEKQSKSKEKTLEQNLLKRRLLQKMKNEQLQDNLRKIKEDQDNRLSAKKDRDNSKDQSKEIFATNVSCRSLNSDKHLTEVQQCHEEKRKQQFQQLGAILQNETLILKSQNILKTAREKLKDYRLRARFLQKEKLVSKYLNISN